MAGKKISGNMRCPCGTGTKYKRCCGVFHRARRVAPTPAQVMRSRYAAFATGQVDYLILTTHPENPGYWSNLEGWRTALRTYCSQTRFEGLTVLKEELDPLGQKAWVTFRVVLFQGKEDGSFEERSLFERDGKDWKYVRGDVKSGAVDLIAR